MILHSLELRGFRAHEQSSVTLGPKLNVIAGPNGAGKTNILEAIHFLAMTKSFLASSDLYALRKGHRAFEIEGRFTSDPGASLRLHLGFARQEGKRILLNKAALDRLSDVVGRVPVVTYAPSDIGLTTEGPEGRRRFVNHVLSQARPAYLDDLLKYRRALRQRNALLQHHRQAKDPSSATISAWTHELVRVGSRIQAARARFVQALSERLNTAYEYFESVGEAPDILYRTSGGAGCLDVDAALDQLRNEANAAAERELAFGRTLIGPHLDELVFRINGMELRRYASRGQHRTFGLILKVASFYFLRDEVDETPILMLDDVAAELDNRRTDILLTLLTSDDVGQSIVTTADPRAFTDRVAFNQQSHTLIYVRDGHIETGAPHDS